MKRALALLALLWCLAAAALYAQIVGPATQFQQSASQLTGCQLVHKDAAVNTQVTLTIPVTDKQTVYLCGLDLTVSNDATGAVVATNLQFTSTNLYGWIYTYSMVGTANTNGIDRSFTFVHPVKSQTPGLPVTIVSPAANSHATYSLNAYYYVVRDP